METFFSFIGLMIGLLFILLEHLFYVWPKLLSAGLCFPGLIIGFMLASYGERMCGSSASSTGHIDSFGNVSITHSPGVSGDANNIIEYLFALIVGFIGSMLFISSIISIIFFFNYHKIPADASHQEASQVISDQSNTNNNAQSAELIT